MTTLDHLTKSPTAMAKTEFHSLAGICPTHGFASYVLKRNFASDISDELERHALDEVRDQLTRCTEAHQRGDMEAFHSAWHAEVAALVAVFNQGARA